MTPIDFVSRVRAADPRLNAVVDEHLADNDELNPRIEGSLRKSDCGQVTDGAACLYARPHDHGLSPELQPLVQAVPL